MEIMCNKNYCRKCDRKIFFNTNQWICNCPLIFKHLVEMIDGGENVSDSNNDVKKIRVSNSKASTFYETS
jgi:hypothetical protein